MRRGDAGAGVISDLESRLNALLEQEQDRGALLRELSALSQDDGFRDLARVWAPALIQRNPAFFEGFLLRHLDVARHRALIGDLLPLIEQADSDADSLFLALYRPVTEQAAWDKEVSSLAASDMTDEALLQALQRRDMQPLWFTLGQNTALALYHRDPDLFTDYLQAHIHGGWRPGTKRFAKLRKEAADRQDDVHWHLFREFATPREWSADLEKLLEEDVGGDRICDELIKRQPQQTYNLDASALAPFVEKYGALVVGYIEENLGWTGRRGQAKLLSALEKQGDERVYWRMFFVGGDTAAWTKALRELASKNISDAQMYVELQLRTPTRGRWWRFGADVGLALYRRNREMFRPFIEAYLDKATEELWQEARRAGDEEFLDFLTFRRMRESEHLIWQAYPPESAQQWGRKPDAAARTELDRISDVLVERLERLHSRAPESYVQHAANILGRYRAFEIWSGLQGVRLHPTMRYLAERHHDAWLACPRAITDVLESTNIFVQIMALGFLAHGGPQAAERVLENLPILRALLLGNAHRATKKQVLRCLEQAAHEGAQYAEPIQALLEDASHYRGKRAIDEPIIASYVRTRRRLRQTADA